MVFGEWPENRVFVGAAVIVGAALYTLHRERRAKAPADRNDAFLPKR
jgi:drug/metabolite transporter (DMT)-like permease